MKNIGARTSNMGNNWYNKSEGEAIQEMVQWDWQVKHLHQNWEPRAQNREENKHLGESCAMEWYNWGWGWMMTDYYLFPYLSSVGYFQNCFHIEGSTVLLIPMYGALVSEHKGWYMQSCPHTGNFFLSLDSFHPCYYRVAVLRLWLEGGEG